MGVQKLSSKNQIVIPKEARQAMGVKGGNELLVVVKVISPLWCPSPSAMQRPYREWLKGCTGWAT